MCFASGSFTASSVGAAASGGTARPVAHGASDTSARTPMTHSSRPNALTRGDCMRTQAGRVANVSRLRQARFARLVARAMDGLPAEFREQMRNIEIVVDDEPTPE